MGETKTGHIVYADIARILATFSIVLLHVSGARLVAPDMASVKFLQIIFMDVIPRWAVPLFIMLSGMLFLDKGKKLSVKRLWTKNIFRMVTAFVFWSFAYNVYTWYTTTGSVKEALKPAFFNIPYGTMHLWFLFIMVGLYIILPFVKRMCEAMTKKEAGWFIALSVILTCLPQSLATFSAFGRYTQYLTRFEINFALGYIGYFTAGWYIHSFEHKKPFRIFSYAMGIAGFLYMYFATVYFSRARGVVADETMIPKTLSAFVMAFAVMMFLKSMFGNKNFKEKTVKVISFTSRLTFGIFLAHEAFLIAVMRYNLYILPDYPLLGIPIEAAIIFVLSGILTFLISKMTFGKYII